MVIVCVFKLQFYLRSGSYLCVVVKVSWLESDCIMLPTTISMGGNNLKKPEHWHTNLASYSPFFLLTTHSSLFVLFDREDIKVVLVPGDYCDIGNQREKRNGVYLPKQSC